MAATLGLSRSPGFLETLIGDGRSLFKLTALCLALAGTFAIFQASTGEFLPHDVAYLQMTARELCGINECRIVHFMVHDRISFGGSLIAIATLYLWLAEFPLRQGERWAWWTLLVSGVTGFGSFLTYLGYGYLDTWHGVATLALFPCFGAGLCLSRRHLRPGPATEPGGIPWQSILLSRFRCEWRSAAGLGRIGLLLAAVGMIGGGLTIQAIGMTRVFVETDLAYLELTREQVDSINPRLIPLIAHDRAGFGGGVVTAGWLLLASAWCSPMTRALWQACLIAGLAGWTTAIGVHPAIGYNDPLHLAPAVLGASLFTTGLLLSRDGLELKSRPRLDGRT